MKVVVNQMAPRLLDVKSNVEEVIEKIRKGTEDGANMVVFPELALTGYFVGENYHRVALKMDSREIRQIASATKGSAAVVGFIEESKSMHFYNAGLVAVDGEALFACRKVNLPNYGIFNERKWFSKGKRVDVFTTGGFNCGVFICNDLWHPSIPYLGVCQKADLFITIMNSSDESMGPEFKNSEAWETINTFYSRVFGVYNVCANRAGEIDLRDCKNFNKTYEKKVDDSEKSGKLSDTVCTYWGGSEIIDPFGNRIAKAQYRKPDVIHAEVTLETIRKKKILLPYLRSEDPYFTHRELERILTYH